MKQFRNSRSIAGAVLVAVCAPPFYQVAHAAAESFPTKPIRWIVPFPPGGSNDILGRLLGAKLSDRIGQQVVIDNRAGANGIIGTELVANAPADGYTILMISTSYIMNAAVRKLPYDVVKSFDPVASVASAPNSILVYPGAGWATLRDMVNKAKSAPGTVNYASTGVGGFNHFGGELFNKVAGIKMTMVPYKGGGPALIDLMAGQVPVMFSSVTQALPHLRTGKVRMLATGASKRVPAVPDVPTVAEAGFPGYEVYVWWGITAPAGTPRAVQDKLRAEFDKTLRDPEVEKFLAREAAEARPMKPAEIRKMIADGVKKWATVAKEAGIKVQ
jgi:tripartite-type tricarboxylate transporter receptor subunit TctC